MLLFFRSSQLPGDLVVNDCGDLSFALVETGHAEEILSQKPFAVSLPAVAVHAVGDVSA